MGMRIRRDRFQRKDKLRLKGELKVKVKVKVRDKDRQVLPEPTMQETVSEAKHRLRESKVSPHPYP
jgi:hypothetical protein